MLAGGLNKLSVCGNALFASVHFSVRITHGGIRTYRVWSLMFMFVTYENEFFNSFYLLIIHSVNLPMIAEDLAIVTSQCTYYYCHYYYYYCYYYYCYY